LKKPATQYLIELLSRCPILVAYRVGDLLSFFVNRIPNKLVAVTEKNIQLGLGDLTRDQQKNLKTETIRHTCYALTELAAVWCWPTEKILARVETEEICDEFRQSTKGRLIIAPHLGSWELLNIWLASKTRLLSLYKPQENQAVDRFILDSRSRNGAQMVATNISGLRRIIRGIKQGDSIMILPDQKPENRKAQINARFFGRAAPTVPLVRNICLREDCEVFIAIMYRLKKRGNFGLSIEPLSHAQLAGSELESAQYLNDEIERLVRLHLDQYQWGYKRFARSEYLSS